MQYDQKYDKFQFEKAHEITSQKRYFKNRVSVKIEKCNLTIINVY